VEVTDDPIDRYKQSKFGQGLLKDTTRVRYENLKKTAGRETIALRENLVDTKIRLAMRAGAFDDLPGKGKPIDLGAYYDLPEHLRVAYQMLKNSGFLPEEVRLKKTLEDLKEKLRNCPSEDEKAKLMKRLTEVSEQYHFCMEYNKGFKKTLY